MGVGATMAPRSQVWNGIWAAFVSPAKASAPTANTRIGAAAPALATPVAMNSSSESVPTKSTEMKSAARKPMPPSRFMMIWRKALRMASSVRVKAMSKNEQVVVISHPMNIHDMWFANTITNMADRNRNMSAKNVGRRSRAPSGSCAWKSRM